MLHNKYFEIMKEFLKDYNRHIYGRELVKRVSLSQKNIALTLDELEDENILKSVNKGNIRNYSLNFLNPILTENLLYFESLRKLEFLEQNKKLIDFSREIEGDIVCVFGSYAKKKQNKNSDLDLFVVGSIDSLKIKRIAEKYGLDVQIFNVSFKGCIDSIKDKKEIFTEVLKNHVILKGTESFVKEVLKWLN